MTSYTVVDTDVFSYLWTGQPQGERFQSYLQGTIPVLSFTTVAEAYFGATKAGWQEKRVRGLEAAVRRFLVAPYDVEMAKLWGKLKAQAQAMGHPLGHNVHSNDLWICSTAIYHEASLVTNNGKHFEGFPGLRVLS